MESRINTFTIVLSIVFSFVVIGQNFTFEQDTTLTLEQKNTLDKFKNAVSPKLPHKYMMEDLYLIKWLRSSKYDVKSAEKRLLSNLEWRKENNMDNIHNEDFSEFKTEFPYYLDGRDRYGRSILLLEIRNLDLRKALIQGKFEKLSRYGDKAVDESCNLVRELGEKYKNITRGHLFLNIDGFSVTQHGCLTCTPFLLRLILQFQQHYPECVDRIIVFNTPSAVEPLLNSIKSVLSQSVKDRLTFYGTNKGQWLLEMAKDFDFDQLPPTIGGTKIYPEKDED